MNDTLARIFLTVPLELFLAFLAYVALMGALRAAQRRSPEFRALLAARKALDANAEREKAAGSVDETPEYLRLNHDYWEAAKACPWYLRVGA